MDFLALPRRDLQALCKRNDVRANMTNAAMADALRALPKVEGIEEYVKVLQPVVVVQQAAVKSVNEEQKVKKQYRPLPRGRRAKAKSSVPIEPEEDKEKLEEDAKRQSNKEDANQATCIGRRGASRRARTVPLPPGKAVAEEDGQEDNLKREAKGDNAPAPVVGRRGASHSRRARPSPAVAVPAAESEVADAEEEQSEEVEEEDLKRKAISMDDEPTLGVGHRGAKRRARPASSVAAVSGKVVAEEEQRAPIPRGRRVKAKGTSSKPVKFDDSDDEKKEEEQEDMQILGVGRRGGASRRAQAALAVALAEVKAEEEQRGPVTRGRRVKAKSTEVVRLYDSKEEKKEDMMLEEEKGDAPAIAVGRSGASQRASAPSEALATKRSAAGTKAEAGDLAVGAVPIRATRLRKPTMKAAVAAAEEKAPRRATRRGGVTRTLLQQEVQEESPGVFSDAEAVGALDVAMEAVPIRETRRRKPTMKAAAAAAKAEEKAPPRATRRGTVMRTVLQPEVQEEPQEAVGAPVSYQRCDALKKLAKESDPRKEELDEVDAPKQDEDLDVVMIEDEKLMEETSGEEISMTDQECTVNSEMQEQQVDDEKCLAPLATQEDKDQGETYISQVAVEETNEEVNTEDALSCQEEGVDNVLHDSVGNTILLDCSSDISWVEVEKAGNITSEMPENQAALDENGDKLNGMVIGDSMSQATVSDKVVQEEKRVLIIDEILQGTDGMHDMEDDQCETIFVEADNLPEQVTDCEIAVEENTTLIVDEQMEVEVPKLTGTNIEVIEEKTPPGVDEKQKSTVTIDTDVVDNHFKTDVVHADEQMEVELTETDDEVVEEMKTPLVVDEKQQSTVTNNGDIVDDHFKTHSAHADEHKEVVTTEVPEVIGTDSEIEEKTPLIVDEKKQSTVTMDGDVVFDHLKTDIAHADEQKEVIGIVTEVPYEVTGTDDEVVEENAVMITEDMSNKGTVPNITHTMDECLKENNFGTDFGHGNEQKKATQEGGARKENALLDEVAESLSKNAITMEPSVCKNSSEKNTAEPMAVLEEKGAKVASESEDLTKLSLGQLKAKIKEKLNAKKNKEAKKRVALARVDENVCRSHSKGQQQNLNLQQH